MHHFRIRYEAHHEARLAVRESLQTTGRALLITSILLSVACLTDAFAGLTNLALFGLLTGLTVVTAFIADIGIAPALCSSRYETFRYQNPTPARSPGSPDQTTPRWRWRRIREVRCGGLPG